MLAVCNQEGARPRGHLQFCKRDEMGHRSSLFKCLPVYMGVYMGVLCLVETEYFDWLSLQVSSSPYGCLYGCFMSCRN